MALAKKWIFPCIILVVLAGMFFLRWECKATVTVAGGKGVHKYKLDRWTGRMWLETYLLTDQGPAAANQLVSSPFSLGEREQAKIEEWARVERDFLTAIWFDLLILCSAWFLRTFRHRLPRITAKPGRKMVIVTFISLAAINGVLSYGVLWYHHQEQANRQLLEVHRIWLDTSRRILEESNVPFTIPAPESENYFEQLWGRINPLRIEAIIEAHEAAEKYVQEITGISGAGSFDPDYIYKVLTNARDTKYRLVRSMMHFSTACLALVIVLRAAIDPKEKTPVSCLG